MMRSSRELRLAANGLLAIHIVMALGTIVLLMRTSNAIDEIQKENLYSIEAVEQMTLTLGHRTPQEAARFERALERAQKNITEEAERPVLAKIEANAQAALNDEPQAHALVLEQLSELSKINHESITKANKGAQQLGLAGAWVTVALAMMSFVISTLILRRVGQRLLSPLHELHLTAMAAKDGDQLRRCSRSEMAAEVGEVAQVFNSLLDKLQHQDIAQEEQAPSLLRAHLLPFLDRDHRAVALLHHTGELIASNLAMVERLTHDEKLKAALMTLPSSQQELPAWVDEFTRHGERAWWVALKPTSVMPGPTSEATEAATEVATEAATQEESEDEVV